METCRHKSRQAKITEPNPSKFLSLRHFAISLLRFYRFAISPMLGPKCRFYPTCSSYAEQALIMHGLFGGSRLALIRLSKCHPWHKGDGFDPVPEPKNHHI
ncbi:MAG: membrane protein insertion efficiency factor YidD [Alteromonadaceae bacterium]|nr:MAG: membrane protein insertion efficiency factor YidD [Alteromonadaceae bacterium]